jgi:hypothetical protein
VVACSRLTTLNSWKPQAAAAGRRSMRSPHIEIGPLFEMGGVTAAR